jgi:PAS domain S-box-containing protein
VARDVTEFWQAEQAVRSSEARYRVLFEGSSEAIALAGSDGRVLEVNRAGEELYGYAAAELRGMTLLDMVAPEARRRAEAALEQLLARGQAVTTLELVAKGERRFTAEVSASVIGTGPERCIIWIARDVTLRQQAVDKLRASEQRFRGIFEAASDGVLIEALDGALLDVNENACRLLGYTKAELLRRRAPDLVLPEMRDWLPGVRNTILAKGRFRAEVVYLRKDGSSVQLELAASVLDDDDGRRILSFIRDITERKQADQRLRESEERYRAVFETTGLATIIVEQDTSVSLVNREFTRLFGYPAAEVQGRSWTEFVHADDLDRMKEFHWLRRVDPSAAPRSYEFRLLDKQAQTRDCHLTIDIIPGTSRSVASIQDITERKRNERELADSRQRYRDLFYGSPLGIYRTTPDGRILMANPVLMRMLGYDSYSEFTARNLEQGGYEPSYPRQRFKEAIERDGVVQGLEAAWLRRDGRTIHVRENARLVRDSQGAPLYYEGAVEDITERKQIERRLLDQEEDFRALAENGSDAIIICDLDADVPNLYANRRAAELFGWTVEELRQRRTAELVTPESLADIQQYTEQRRTGQPAPGQYEVTVLRADGSRMPVEVTISPTHWQGRQALIVNLRDAGERRRITDQLARASARYQSLIEAIGDGVSTADRNGRFTYVNDVVIARSGRNREWWLGRYHADVVAPEFRATAEANVAAALRGQTPAPYEMAYPAGDGRLVEIEMHVKPLLEAGQVVGVLGISRDISARKQVERRLRESEEQFRQLFDLSPDGIAVHQDGRLVTANPAAARMIGFQTPAEAIGRPILDFVAPEHRDQVVARVRGVLEQGLPAQPIEEQFIRQDGSRIDVEVRNAPFVWAGRPAVQVVFREVGERRRLTQAVTERTAELEAILANAPEGVAVEWDGVVAFANHRFAELFGYDSAAEVAGMPSSAFAAPEDSERLAGYTDKRLAGEPAPSCYTFRGLRRDGTRMEMAATVSAYRQAGKECIIAFVRELPCGGRPSGA